MDTYDYKYKYVYDIYLCKLHIYVIGKAATSHSLLVIYLKE